MNTEILENIGFTKGEIKVYLALLELGNSTSGPIILDSGVARSKVYEILEKLKQKGLVSEVIKRKTKYFRAVDPEKILDYIQYQQNELNIKSKKFRKILPELKLKQQLEKDKQEARIYEGYEGVKTFFREILSQMKEGNEYLAMTLSGDMWDKESVKMFFLKFHQQRAEKKVKAKILYNFGAEEFKHKMNFSKTGLYEIKSTDVILPTGIAIFNNIVATLIWGENPKLFAIISKENADHYRKFFYDLWDKS